MSSRLRAALKTLAVAITECGEWSGDERVNSAKADVRAAWRLAEQARYYTLLTLGEQQEILPPGMHGFVLQQWLTAARADVHELMRQIDWHADGLERLAPGIFAATEVIRKVLDRFLDQATEIATSRLGRRGGSSNGRLASAPFSGPVFAAWKNGRSAQPPADHPEGGPHSGLGLSELRCVRGHGRSRHHSK
jgi:hypothetical protein